MTWKITAALQSNFVQAMRPNDPDHPCHKWEPDEGGWKLYRIEDVSRSPFDEDLRENRDLDGDFRRRQDNGEYDRDMLPQYERFGPERPDADAVRGGRMSYGRKVPIIRRYQSTDTPPGYSQHDEGHPWQTYSTQPTYQNGLRDARWGPSRHAEYDDHERDY